MDNNKKLRVIIIAIILIIIIIGVILEIILYNSGKYTENSNLKIAEISKQNSVYQYTNKWKMEAVDLQGSFTIKYNEEKHTIDMENKIDSEEYKDILKNNTTINGDLILNNKKNGFLTYNNEFIPYSNSENNSLGIINSKIGYNIELENGKKVLDIFQSSLQSEIEIFLFDNTTEKEKKQLEEKIKKISSVKKIIFRSKEDALKVMKERAPDLVEEYDEEYDEENNIFPESYIVTLANNDNVKIVKNEIENMNLSCIKKITTSDLSKERNVYLEMLGFDFVVKENNKYYFAQILPTQNLKINYLEGSYLDIYVARDNNKEIKGFIVEKENNKKVFLNKFREEVIKEYEFMNFVEINSENYIICSNFNIKTEENINDANFEIFDLDGNSKKIEKSNFIKLLKLKQKNSFEYKLFE